MPYTASPSCLAAAKAAAGDDLTEQEVLDAFQRVSDYRDRLRNTGQPFGLDARARRFAAEEAERTRVAAALQRRVAALNVLTHDKLQQQVGGMVDQGVKPMKALLSIFEGMQRGIKNARVSIAATRGGLEAKYIGTMLSDIQRDAPHIIALLHDEKLDADTLAEMMEIKPGGNRGVTGNKDAVYLADTFAKYAELARREHNRLGGNIGKLNGWNGVQMHDDFKMISGGPGAKERWIGYITTKLDLERTFPDGLTPDEVHDALGSIYDTIITGTPATPTATEMGQHVSPAGLAKSLAKSRVLHFKDAAAALDYREKFGYSNTIGGMLAHLRRMSSVNANMTVLGPNPEVMFGALAAETQRRIRNATEVPPGVKYGPIGRRYTPTLEQWKNTESEAINTQSGPLRQALDIATGLASRPVNTTIASIGSTLRMVQSMAKLGAALPTSFADVPTVALSGMFRGSGFWKTLMSQFEGLATGGGEHGKEISYLLGEGFDGLLGHINATMAGNDRLPGLASKMMEQFFKWNGLTWWTDAGRATAGRIVSAELGMRSGTAYKALPPKYRHVLDMNGIDEGRWDIMRQAALRLDNGKAYLTPDAVERLPDNTFVPMVADRILAARTASRVDEARSPIVREQRMADFQQRRAAIIESARADVALSLRRFVADEATYGVIETDARSQRTATWGLRPGTMGGDAMRFIMQFKGFPIAYGQRVLGRAFYGHRPDATMGERGAHIGALLAGMTVAGYMSMTAKDALKGYTPRDPRDPRTMLAALQQGGAVGVYGDYLFGSTNRFGGSLLETLAGPSVGSVSQLGDILLDARDAAVTGGQDKFSGSRAFSTIMGQVPYANLHFVKPALDYLFLNSMREILSPGFLRKQQQDRMKQYGQRPISSMVGAPPSLDPFNASSSF